MSVCFNYGQVFVFMTQYKCCTTNIASRNALDELLVKKLAEKWLG